MRLSQNILLTSLLHSWPEIQMSDAGAADAIILKYAIKIQLKALYSITITATIIMGCLYVQKPLIMP